MPALDAAGEQNVAAYAAEVERVLGGECVAVVLYGSAAGADWVPGRSDVNTVIVLRGASTAALDALAPIVAKWRRRGFALPVVLDREQVAHAGHLFPMELDDIVRQHRLIVGRDPFTEVAVDSEALRRECAQEAFGKILRLRALYVQQRGDRAALRRMFVDSVKTFLTVIRHVLRLRGVTVPQAYEGVLTAAEDVLGPLPAMRTVLAHRHAPRRAASALDAVGADYIAEVERIVASVTNDCP
jgi:predicted nucleotidyltransferase